MQTALMDFFLHHWILAPVFFVVLRTVTVVISPIPGLFVDIPAILAFGWAEAFVCAEIGIMAGSTISFFIARRFREPLVARFSRLQKVVLWEGRLSEADRFWSLVVLRVVSIQVFDYLNYAAGLTNIRFKTFFFSTFLGSFPYVFLTFYVGGLSVAWGHLYWFAAALAAVATISWLASRGIGKN